MGADKEYLKILHLAARDEEAPVERAINHLMATDERLSAEAVTRLVRSGTELPSVRDVAIDEVALSTYDELLSELEPAA
jgi:DNA-binding transcriptional regulator YhcF (GntR family)